MMQVDIPDPVGWRIWEAQQVVVALGDLDLTGRRDEVESILLAAMDLMEKCNAHNQ